MSFQKTWYQVGMSDLLLEIYKYKYQLWKLISGYVYAVSTCILK